MNIGVGLPKTEFTGYTVVSIVDSGDLLFSVSQLPAVLSGVINYLPACQPAVTL